MMKCQELSKTMKKKKIRLSAIFLLSELIFGFIIKSLSLQSDSLNKLFNEVSLNKGLVGSILSKKKASEKMTFG